MREIKFRCWVSSTKNMVEWKELEDHGDIYRLIKQPSAYPLMQFTGLKDINGVEIYEGDITAYEFNGKIVTGEVLYKRDQFIINAPFGAYGKGIFGRASKPEVIGNIYENPELLEGNQHE